MSKEQPQRTTIGGVRVRKITQGTYDKHLHRDGVDYNPCNNSHVTPKDQGKYLVCFPDIAPTIRTELILDVSWVSHYTKCRDKESLVTCLIITRHNGCDRYWKAPKHKVGKCPFFTYTKPEKENWP